MAKKYTVYVNNETDAFLTERQYEDQLKNEVRENWDRKIGGSLLYSNIEEYEKAFRSMDEEYFTKHEVFLIGDIHIYERFVGDSFVSKARDKNDLEFTLEWECDEDYKTANAGDECDWDNPSKVY